MSVDELARGIRAGLTMLPTDSLHQAISHLRDSEQTLVQLSSGSSSPELPQTAGALRHAFEAVVHVIRTLDVVRANLGRYQVSLGVGGPAPTPSAPKGAALRVAPTPSSRTPSSSEQIESLRGALPPTVPRPNPENRKTHGRWLDPSGVEQVIVSGGDRDADEAWRLLKRAGMPANKEPASTTHVEVKLAARMVREGQRHVEVVINNRPCPGPYGCDELLPVILPTGYSMTVHGPNYRKTYTGGEQW